MLQLVIKPFLILCLILPVCRASMLAAEEGAHKNPLYSVALADNILKSKVFKRVRQKKIVYFYGRSFPGRIKKFEVFLVLDRAEKGVIAEIAVRTKPKRRQKRIQARVIRMARAVRVADLVGKTLVRLEDLRNIIHDNHFFGHNPSLNFGFLYYSQTNSAVNPLAGASLNPRVNGFGFYVEAFTPQVHGGQWVNWLGLRYKSLTQTASTIDIKSVNQQATQPGKLNSESRSAEVVIRPWFNNFFIHRAAIFYGFLNQHKTMLHLDQSVFINEANELRLSRSFASFGTELEIRPAGPLHMGLRVTMINGSVFKIYDSTTPGKQYEGNWDQMHITGYLAVYLPLYKQLIGSISIDMDRREDTIYNLKDYGRVEEFSSADFSFLIKTGIFFSF